MNEGSSKAPRGAPLSFFLTRLTGSSGPFYTFDMKIKAVVHKAEEGGYWAEVPALPGCVSQGETMDELRANLKEAIEGWLEAGSPESADENADQILELAL
jgi:predicted RNase H-like HicB family nuclease